MSEQEKGQPAPEGESGDSAAKERHQEFEELFGKLQAVGEKLQEQAIRDSLTGLLTRRAFEDEVARSAARVRIPDNNRMNGLHCLSVMMLDIDNFKKINDTYGHSAGDEVIKAVARKLEKISRKGDVVARWGGEEFAIAFPDADAAAVLKKFGYDPEKGQFAHCEISVEVEDAEGEKHILAVTLSGGITEYRKGKHEETGAPTDGEKLEEAMRRADRALYRSKEEGKNRITPSEEETVS